MISLRCLWLPSMLTQPILTLALIGLTACTVPLVPTPSATPEVAANATTVNLAVTPATVSSPTVVDIVEDIVADTTTPVSEVPLLLPSPTPLVIETPQPAGQGLAPAPAPVGTVVYYESTIDLPTYSGKAYQSNAVDPVYNWSYTRFDWERFNTENPTPELRTYRLVVLENSYLKVLVMPDVGGRILQVIHKASGDTMFYQNSVVKPSPWGPAQQLGWTAIGGLEWNLPIVEHGYDWAAKWGVLPLRHSEDLAAVTVFTPMDGRVLNASITISLRAGAASFEVESAITNVSPNAVSFDYWLSAALAPGAGNTVSDQLRFILPTTQMRLHSSFDSALPASGELMTWPIAADGRDLSRLGTWQQFIGLFEAPAAHGPFAGVYDSRLDAGAVRVFPAEIVRGSKIFGLGWNVPLDSTLYTDDGSQYVELHAGLTPSFDEHYTLSAGSEVRWRETWYPVRGIGGLSVANEVGALAVEKRESGLTVGFYPTRPFGGAIVVTSEGSLILKRPFAAWPDQPFIDSVIEGQLPTGLIVIQVEDSVGNQLLDYPLP